MRSLFWQDEVSAASLPSFPLSCPSSFHPRPAKSFALLKICSHNSARFLSISKIIVLKLAVLPFLLHALK
jgi:hypothetical protein